MVTYEICDVRGDHTAHSREEGRKAHQGVPEGSRRELRRVNVDDGKSRRGPQLAHQSQNDGQPQL